MRNIFRGKTMCAWGGCTLLLCSFLHFCPLLTLILTFSTDLISLSSLLFLQDRGGWKGDSGSEQQKRLFHERLESLSLCDVNQGATLCIMSVDALSVSVSPLSFFHLCQWPVSLRPLCANRNQVTVIEPCEPMCVF